MKDEDLFIVDRTATANKPVVPKLTKKQQAALEKITKNITQEHVTLPKPSTTSKILKKPAKLPRGNAILALKKGPKAAAPAAKKKNFDVWTTDLTPKIPKSKLENQEAAEHFLKVVKKKQPKTPGKSITSLLPAVQIAEGGASYNPESAEYQEYVAKIAGEEQKLIDHEAKIKAGIEPQWEKVCVGVEKEEIGWKFEKNWRKSEKNGRKIEENGLKIVEI